MKNSVGGGKNMGTVTRTEKKAPSNTRIIKLLKKKKIKKELKNEKAN